MIFRDTLEVMLVTKQIYKCIIDRFSKRLAECKKHLIARGGILEVKVPQQFLASPDALEVKVVTYSVTQR